jgi:methionyl-tRNA formyltransferase
LAIIENGNVITTIQNDNPEIKTAYKLNKENCKIDWNKSGEEIHNLIRGLSPYPCAWCYFEDKDEQWNVKIYDAKFIEETHNHQTGTILTTKKELKIAVNNGFIEIMSLQFPGKKKMSTSELLNGMNFSDKTQAN